MAYGFSSGGSDFYTGIMGRSITNMNSNNPSQPSYRTQLSQVFLDPTSQIAQHQTSTTNFTAQSVIGKRSLADFQAHQQQLQQPNPNLNPALNGLLRSVKPRMYQHTSPISTLSPIELSVNMASELPSLSRRYGMPLLQQLRPQPINLGPGPTIHSTNHAASAVPHMNTLQQQNRGVVIGGHESKKKMMNRLQELEKELLDDNEDEEGDAVSVITNTNSEWSETIQNLITSSTPNPISPSPTSSSSSSSSSTSVTTPHNCSRQTLLDAASAIYEGKNDVAYVVKVSFSHEFRGTVSGRAENQMDWNVNNAFKTYKDIEPKSVMDMAIIQNVDPIDIGLGTSEKANPVVPTKRKKTMTSVYLKYFETAPDGKSRRCKFCGQSYSIATATGNLGRHLSNRHPGYDKSGDSVTTSAPQPITVIKKAQPQGKANVDYDHLNWLLIKWLILASLPPSTLEEKWLANSFKFLNPSIQLWSGDKYKAVFREVFRSMQEDVRTSLEQVSSKVSIILDFWTSYEQIFYMSVTCQWIDEHWCFQKILLDICHIPYPCGGSEIYHSLIKVLKMYNLENRVLSCTHDNSQNAIHACHTLKEDLDGQKVAPFCYIPCAARALNLIIDDGLRTTKPVISKIREFVLELNSSGEMAEDFIQITTAYQEGSWKLPLETSARWSGNYQMLDLVCKAGKSMDSVIRKYDETLGGRMVLSSAEKNAVNIVHGYFEPFYKTTNNICTNKLLTVGLVLFFMDHISEMITICRESRHSPDWLKNAAEEMAKKARSYNNQVSNIFTYMTAILDPRIKSELIPESLGTGNYLDEARNHFIRNYSSSHFSSMTSGYGSQEIEDGGSVSFAEEIARKKRRASLNNATDELTQYLSEPPAPIPTDVLEWWKVNSTRYPRLSTMARDFLAVQPTSVAPEELFCSKGDEIDKQRFCMPHDSTQAIFCIRSWTQGGIKLKYKSTEIDYERLMELAVAATADNGNAGSDKKQKLKNENC